MTDRTRPKNFFFSKDIEDLNNTINHLGPIDNYRIIHPITAEYKFFARVLDTFTKLFWAVNLQESFNTLHLVPSIP